MMVAFDIGDNLGSAITRLPTISIGKLNTIIAQQSWRDFETETF
jgi:hypothetical protein